MCVYHLIIKDYLLTYLRSISAGVILVIGRHFITSVQGYYVVVAVCVCVCSVAKRALCVVCLCAKYHKREFDDIFDEECLFV